MTIRSLGIAALGSLVLAATAAAAGGPSVTASLTPTKVSAPSTVSITMTGPFPAGLPSSLALQVQNGFASSVKSVSTLCPASAASTGACPAASEIGTGSITATVFGFSATIPLTLWLGAPSQPGDIATVYLYGSLGSLKLPVSGRLFTPSGGGLEMLFTGFPSVSIRPTIQSLSLTAHAERTTKKTVTTGKRKHRKKKTITTVYSFITNPSRCTGSWTGTVTAVFTGSSVSLPLAAPCTN